MILGGINIAGRVTGYSDVWVPDNTNVSILTHFDSGYTSAIGPNWSASQFSTATVGINNLAYKYGTGSLSFTNNGTTSSYAYVSMADQSANQFGTGSFTLEAWVRPTSLSHAGTIISKYAGGIAARYQFNISTDGKLGFSIQDSSGSSVFLLQTPASSVAINTWQHVAVVRNGTTVSLYVNGISLASGTSAYNLNVTGVFALGSFINAVSGFRNGFNGQIDEFRASKAAKYTGNFTPPPGPF